MTWALNPVLENLADVGLRSRPGMTAVEHFRQHQQFSRSGDKADRWDFFGNPADFKSGDDEHCFPPRLAQLDLFTRFDRGRDLLEQSIHKGRALNTRVRRDVR